MNEKYAIPGFQQPDHPKLDERVTTQADGLVDFMFLDNCPLSEPMPAFIVYIDIERGREINRQAFTYTNRFIYDRKNDDSNTKSYWFRMRQDTLTILPGTYRFRFVVNGAEVAQKSLTIENHPAVVVDPFDQGCLIPRDPEQQV